MAFKDIESQADTKIPYKRFNESMELFGGAAHAMLGAMVPVFGLKEQLAYMTTKIKEEGVSPFTAAADGPGSLLQWMEDLSYALNHTVFRGVKDAAILGAAGFNEQVKGVRKMVAEHPRCDRLSVYIDKCPALDPFFPGVF